MGMYCNLHLSVNGMYCNLLLVEMMLPIVSCGLTLKISLGISSQVESGGIAAGCGNVFSRVLCGPLHTVDFLSGVYSFVSDLPSLVYHCKF
jgi:hypothetical protein